MSLGLGELANLVGVCERLTKVLEFEFLLQMVLFDHLPSAV